MTAEVTISLPAATFSGTPADKTICPAPKIINRNAMPPAMPEPKSKIQPTRFDGSLGIQPKEVHVPQAGPKFEPGLVEQAVKAPVLLIPVQASHCVLSAKFLQGSKGEVLPFAEHAPGGAVGSHLQIGGETEASHTSVPPV